MTLDFDKLVLAPCMATFGEVNQGFPAVIYTPKGGTPFTINGIFDPMASEVQIKNGEPVTVHIPIMGCKISDFPNPPANWTLLQDDTVQARGKTYIVREARDDSHGGLKLYLNNTVLA